MIPWKQRFPIYSLSAKCDQSRVLRGLLSKPSAAQPEMIFYTDCLSRAAGQKE